MPAIDVLDSTIHYEDRGSGATVVFLHGNPSSSHMWPKVPNPKHDPPPPRGWQQP